MRAMYHVKRRPQGAVYRIEKPRVAYTVTVSATATSMNSSILSKFM